MRSVDHLPTLCCVGRLVKYVLHTHSAEYVLLILGFFRSCGLDPWIHGVGWVPRLLLVLCHPSFASHLATNTVSTGGVLGVYEMDKEGLTEDSTWSHSQPTGDCMYIGSRQRSHDAAGGEVAVCSHVGMQNK